VSTRQTPSPWPVNPLTPYDVLGYLAPGATLVLSLYGLEFWVQHSREGGVAIHTPVYTLVQHAMPPSSEGAWAMAALFLIGLFGICYVLGHIIGSISAFLIDRVYVAKGHGYPYRLLLGLQPEHGEHGLTVPFYRALFFWSNVYLLLRFLGLPDLPLISDTLHAVFVLAAYVVLVLLIVLIVLKTLASAKYGHSETRLRHWLNGKGSWFATLAERAIGGANLLYSGITALVGNYLRTHEPFPQKVRDAFHEKFYKTFGMKVEDAGTTTFWFAYIHVRNLSDSLTEPAANWLLLYSFARNLGTALYLAFLYTLLWWLGNATVVEHLSQSSRMTLAAISLGLLVCAFAMLMRFYYLYADYFSKYVLRAFLYSTTVKDFGTT
jgi:hypothetical protein